VKIVVRAGWGLGMNMMAFLQPASKKRVKGSIRACPSSRQFD
jgi:hypothetical protein